jgi:predicted Zn-dependent peptidase
LVSLEESGYFVIGTDVKKEFTRLALDEIYREIEIMKTQSIPEDELETVTSYMHGSYLGSINSAFALMDKYKTIHYAKLDYDYFNRYIQTLKTIKQQDIQEMAQKWFLGLNEVVVGNYQ